MRPIFDFEELVKMHDIDSLQEALRYSGDSRIRQIAALALGELSDLEAVESLIRSIMEDPEPIVQSTARKALTMVLGNQAEGAIAAYQTDEPNADPWLTEAPDDDEDEIDLSIDDGEDEFFKAMETGALIDILRSSDDSFLKIQAIRRLAQSMEVPAVNALISIALHDDEKLVRLAAEAVLKELYGEGYQEIIDSYEKDDVALEEFDSEEYEDIDIVDEDVDVLEGQAEKAEIVEPSPDSWTKKNSSPFETNIPVIQAERVGNPVTIFITLVVIVIMVIVWYVVIMNGG